MNSVPQCNVAPTELRDYVSSVFVCVYVFYSLADTPVSSADITIYTLGIGTLLYGLISSGETSVHFLQLMPFTISNVCFTRYPSLLGGQWQYGIGSLPDTSTHDRQCESRPRHSDLESNTVSTRPHAPIFGP